MKRVKHIASFEIKEPIDTLFPLFSAEGEKLWVPDWNYQNIMGSTDLHENYVFITKSHDHATTDALWIVKRYEPRNHIVQFYKIESTEKLGIIEVQCKMLEKSHTKVQVTYEYIGLSAVGEEFVAAFSKEKYEAFISEWKELLINYFATKQTL